MGILNLFHGCAKAPRVQEGHALDQSSLPVHSEPESAHDSKRIPADESGATASFPRGAISECNLVEPSQSEHLPQDLVTELFQKFPHALMFVSTKDGRVLHQNSSSLVHHGNLMTPPSSKKVPDILRWLFSCCPHQLDEALQAVSQGLTWMKVIEVPSSRTGKTVLDVPLSRPPAGEKCPTQLSGMHLVGTNDDAMMAFRLSSKVTSVLIPSVSSSSKSLLNTKSSMEEVMLAEHLRGGSLTGRGNVSTPTSHCERAPEQLTEELPCPKCTAWHQVILLPLKTSAGEVLLLSHHDITPRAELERQTVALTEALFDVLGQMLPRHMLQTLVENSDNQSVATQVDKGAALDALAMHHENISIMFMDLVGFTEMSEQVTPREVMGYLNRLFTIFDKLTDLYGVYKVETAGDCYIVAGGLMERDVDGLLSLDQHGDPSRGARRVIAFSWAIIQASKDLIMPNGKLTKIRVGVHSGSVTSGVVGHKLPKFSLFGDTMNTASRMESTCPPSHIQISNSTYKLLSSWKGGLDDMKLHIAAKEVEGAASIRLPNKLLACFQCRGPVEIKGKGQMETFICDCTDPDSCHPLEYNSCQLRSSLSQRAEPVGLMDIFGSLVGQGRESSNTSVSIGNSSESNIVTDARCSRPHPKSYLETSTRCSMDMGLRSSWLKSNMERLLVSNLVMASASTLGIPSASNLATVPEIEPAIGKTDWK